MIITDNRLTTKTTFGSLCEGDVFFYPADEEYYMKTDLICERNAVCLVNGDMAAFLTNEKVEAVDAELVISG